MELSFLSVLGMLATLGLIAGVGIYAGKKVSSAQDFTSGSNMGTSMVAGSLVGTLVGGASTIGTAQLAFNYGFSAWWFSLGGGIGLLIMALFFAKPLRSSGLVTLPQILTREYGKKVATEAAILMSVGTFMSIVSQLLSGVALVTSVCSLPAAAAMAIVVVLMVVYVVFGGAWGAGMVGIVKTVLLYVATFVCGIVSIKLAGGLDAFTEALPADRYFNLFARGYWKDGGAGASLVFGVLTTQSYILPVVSARSLKVSKAGTVLGGVLTTVIGLAGIFVGLYMRVHMPDTKAAAVLPQFILTCLPDFIGGVILATLLIALVGTGAGLALGISSMLCNDIFKALLRPNATGKECLRFSRCVIVVILIAAALFGTGKVGSMILSWSFLSMGLRGAVAFAPLCFALFSPGRIHAKFAVAAITAGPLLVIVGYFLLPSYIDPLFLGMGGSLLICFAGWLQGTRQKLSR